MHRPLFVGLFTLAATVLLGIGIAFFTGAITPSQVLAQVGPPCCIPPPPPPPTITLAMLAHVSAQPLAYLYLSQIPYTGLELGPVGTILYWFVIICTTLVLAHMTLFKAIPLLSRSVSDFGSRVSVALNAPGAAHAAPMRHNSAPITRESPSMLSVAAPEAPRGHSSYEGFKSFAHDGALSIDDIVKGLSRHHPAPSAPQNVEPILNVEPVYKNVEPVYENVEPIAPAASGERNVPQASVSGFVSALLAGDRVAVFADLRQHLQGGGSAESLLSEAACLLDDAYRARIDGTTADADIARRAAHLPTPTLEKLVAALATAVDSSYSTDVTGAKLALTRALAQLGV